MSYVHPIDGPMASVPEGELAHLRAVMEAARELFDPACCKDPLASVAAHDRLYLVLHGERLPELGGWPW